MYAQAVSDAAVKTDVTGFALSRSPGRQPNSYLTAISSLERKAPGETLFAEGDETNSIYEIVRGMLRLVKLLPDGRQQITGFLSAGRLLGLAPEGAHVYTVEAITEVTLCDEVPGFAKPLLTVTSHELRVASRPQDGHGESCKLPLLDRRAARRGRHAGGGFANDTERHRRLSRSDRVLDTNFQTTSSRAAGENLTPSRPPAAKCAKGATE